MCASLIAGVKLDKCEACCLSKLTYHVTQECKYRRFKLLSMSLPEKLHLSPSQRGEKAVVVGEE